jgi:hypothetical protein
MAYNSYHEGKIYLIRSPSRPDLIYYGSTTKPLQQRFSIHKWYADKTFGNISSKILIDCGDAIIELVENYECESRFELECRERWYIEHNPCVNIVIPTRKITDKEYYEQNKDAIIIRKKEYYEKNKDRLMIKLKEYREQNRDKINAYQNERITCICGKSYSRSNKGKHEQSQHHIDYINTHSDT